MTRTAGRKRWRAPHKNRKRMHFRHCLGVPTFTLPDVSITGMMPTNDGSLSTIIIIVSYTIQMMLKTCMFSDDGSDDVSNIHTLTFSVHKL